VEVNTYVISISIKIGHDLQSKVSSFRYISVFLQPEVKCFHDIIPFLKTFFDWRPASEVLFSIVYSVSFDTVLSFIILGLFFVVVFVFNTGECKMKNNTRCNMGYRYL